MKVRDIRLRLRGMTVCRKYAWGPVAYRRKRAYYGPDHYPPSATDLRWTACVQEAHKVSWNYEGAAEVSERSWRLLEYRAPEADQTKGSSEAPWRLYLP